MIKIKRPIVIITFGYIIGIILGLYFKFGIALFFLLIIYLTKFKNKIFKLIFNIITIVAIIISTICGFISILIHEFNYYNFYSKNYEELTVTGVIVSNKEETEYYNKYILKSNTKKFIIYTKKQIELQYGDFISTKAKYSEPPESRNYKGFNYKQYLKTEKIYGILKSNSIEIIAKDKANFKWINKLRMSIKYKIDMLLPTESASILNSLLLGINSEISEENIDNFSLSSLSHLLAISGTHIATMIYIFTLIFAQLKIPTKLKYIFLILILSIFTLLTGFAESVVRASLSSIILILSKVLYRKRDMLTSISIPVLISLIYNPYLINSISLQLSYGATLGVIYISPTIKKFMERYIPNKLLTTISVTLGAQIAILPIMLINFNVFSFSFVISNILAIPILNICITLGIITVCVSYLSILIAQKIAIVLNLSLQLLILISKIFSNFSIYIITLDTYLGVGYYAFTILYSYYFHIRNLPKISFKMKYRVIANLIRKIKIKKIIITMCIIIIFTSSSFKLANKGFKMYFIDVGQGDSTLIITNTNKKILIDTGENRILDYLLDRKICKLDYLLISHFDSDHCDGAKEILKNIKVKHVIVSKQIQSSIEFEEIMKNVQEKRIDTIVVQYGDKIKIDKDTTIQILWPDFQNLIKLENISNNNSIVAKVIYMNTSILFTGDIEEIAEKEILKLQAQDLQATILKVAHHGSKGSTSQAFLDMVKPKIALIGVGINNKFGHPNIEVIQRLEKMSTNIYRTDEKGEIILEIQRNGEIKIKTHI